MVPGRRMILAQYFLECSTIVSEVVRMMGMMRMTKSVNIKAMTTIMTNNNHSLWKETDRSVLTYIPFVATRIVIQLTEIVATVFKDA